MNVIKNLLKLFLVYFLLITNSLSTNPSEFIDSISNEASGILSSKLSDNEKVTKLKIIAENSVDIDGVGLYTLGKYRKTLTDEQKIEYKSYLKYFKSFPGRLVVYNENCSFIRKSKK